MVIFTFSREIYETRLGLVSIILYEMTTRVGISIHTPLLILIGLAIKEKEEKSVIDNGKNEEGPLIDNGKKEEGPAICKFSNRIF